MHILLKCEDTYGLSDWITRALKYTDEVAGKRIIQCGSITIQTGLDRVNVFGFHPLDLCADIIVYLYDLDGENENERSILTVEDFKKRVSEHKVACAKAGSTPLRLFLPAMHIHETLLLYKYMEQAVDWSKVFSYYHTAQLHTQILRDELKLRFPYSEYKDKGFGVENKPKYWQYDTKLYRLELNVKGTRLFLDGDHKKGCNRTPKECLEFLELHKFSEINQSTLKWLLSGDLANKDVMKRYMLDEDAALLFHQKVYDDYMQFRETTESKPDDDPTIIVNDRPYSLRDQVVLKSPKPVKSNTSKVADIKGVEPPQGVSGKATPVAITTDKQEIQKSEDFDGLKPTSHFS